MSLHEEREALQQEKEIYLERSTKLEERKDKVKVQLYEKLRGRQLCFEPDPLDVPTGFRGEIFTVPQGGYAVVLINEGMSVLDPANRAEPTINLRLARRIKEVRVLSPLDHEGSKTEPVYRENGELQLTVGDFRGAAVLFLKPEI